MTNGLRNRNAGHSWERDIVSMLKDIGFSQAATSRLVSKFRDDQKIDIVNKDELVNGRFPYNIQAKCTSYKMDYDKELKKLPNDIGIPNVIFHKATKKVGTRFLPKGYYAFLDLKDFLTIIESNEKHKKAYQLLNSYFDYIPEDEKIKVDKLLKQLKL